MKNFSFDGPKKQSPASKHFHGKALHFNYSHCLPWLPPHPTQIFCLFPHLSCINLLGFLHFSLWKKELYCLWDSKRKKVNWTWNQMNHTNLLIFIQSHHLIKNKNVPTNSTYQEESDGEKTMDTVVLFHWVIQISCFYASTEPENFVHLKHLEGD